MIYRLIFFLVINFAALAIGSFFTAAGVPSDWYATLVKAPWTPPGWAFGFAWTTIMLFFGVYMAYLWPLASNKKLLTSLYALQWVLNVGWNPTFFYYHDITVGLILISGLTILMGGFLVLYWSVLKLKSMLILPYFIWLIVATSLNAYIFMKN